MKKILFYTDTPIHGGAERHMLLLASKLNKEMYEVILVCSKYKQLNEWCKQWKKEGFKVYRLNVLHKHDPRHLPQLKKIIQEEKPDLIHNHLWNPGSNRYSFSSVNHDKTKIISTEHDPFPLHGLKKAIKKKCLKKTDHTITVSNHNQKLMQKLYPEVKNKISLVHNGIDTEKFEKEYIRFTRQRKEQLRRTLFKASLNDYIILTIAELHPRKGLIYLIEAFREIDKEMPNTKLIITGKGPQEKILKKLIKKLNLTDKVILIGQQENIAQILKSSNMFVLPSIKEAFGLVLIEAMTASLPIVASSTGGITELIEHKKNGMLVEPQNYAALKKTILELMNNNALCQKLGYIGHNRAKTIFDVKQMVRKTEEIYEKVLNQ